MNLAKQNEMRFDLPRPSGSRIKLKIAKLFRILTLAQILALATLCTMFAYDSQWFGDSALLFSLAIIFLTVLPISAYPLQPIVPGFRGRGREGQRSLAMLFAVGGYILGCITNLFFNAPAVLWLVYLEYLLSGLIILVFNKVFHLRASAHACGVAGPAVMLAYLGITPALIVGAVLYALSLWGSLVMKRHTLPQFLGGSVVPVAVLVVLHFVLF